MEEENKEVEKEIVETETASEVVDEVETKEEVNEPKEEKIVVVKEVRKSGIIGKIFNVLFWVAILALLAIWLTDYLAVMNSSRAENGDFEPKLSFCISNKVHTYDDGTVEECMGLGYKVYNYKRSSMERAVQFGPFFLQIKETK